jgi:tRNA threonylcarbamoyladenosine biosynthesis protein TsaB
MILLCADIATSTESIAIVQIKADASSKHGEPPLILGEYSAERGGIHGPDILDDIHTLLREQNLTIGDIDGFCVGLGPGSFTGLRISLATIKGLALATSKPIFGARTTLMLKENVGAPETVAVVDARRNQVYIEGGPIKNPICCDPSDVFSMLGDDHHWVLVGDGALKYTAVLMEHSACSIPEEIEFHRPRASTLARLIDPNRDQPLATLEPVYVRKSDAEINYPDGFPDVAHRPPRS